MKNGDKKSVKIRWEDFNFIVGVHFIVNGEEDQLTQIDKKIVNKLLLQARMRMEMLSSLFENARVGFAKKMKKG